MPTDLASFQSLVNLQLEWKQYLDNNNDTDGMLNAFISIFASKENQSLNNTSTLMPKGKDLQTIFSEIIAAKGLAKEQSYNYKAAVKDFIATLLENKLPLTKASLNRKSLKLWEERMVNEGKKATSIKKYIKNLILLIKNGVNYGILPDSVLTITSYQVTIKDTRNKEEMGTFALNDDEIEAFEHVKVDGDLKRFQKIFILQMNVGQRVSDLYRLNDWSITTDSITIKQQKTNNPATLLNNPRLNNLVNEVKSYTDLLTYTEVVFRQKYNKALKQIAREANLNRIIKDGDEEAPIYDAISSHVARHTFISKLTRDGISEELIAIQTGHTNSNTIKNNYTHLTTSDRANLLRQGLQQQQTISPTVQVKDDNTSVEEYKAKQIKIAREMLLVLGYDYKVWYYKNGKEKDFNELFALILDQKDKFKAMGINNKLFMDIAKVSDMNAMEKSNLLEYLKDYFEESNNKLNTLLNKRK